MGVYRPQPQDLDGHIAIQHRIVRHPHHAHPTLAQVLEIRIALAQVAGDEPVLQSFRRADFAELAKLWSNYFPPRYDVDQELLKLNTVDSITDALREGLTAYYKSNNQSKVMVAQQLFGVTAAKLLLSRLDEVASNVRPKTK